MSPAFETGASELRRAGFWQRVLAFFIDCALVTVPLTLIAAPLYSVTDGRIFMSSPIVKYQACRGQSSVPANLAPAPPDSSTFATKCSIYTIIGLTYNALIVGRQTVNHGVTVTVSTTYALNANGAFVNGQKLDLNDVASDVVALMILSLQWRSGQTLGQKVMSIRLIMVQSPDMKRIKFRGLLIRYCAIFLFPMICLIPLVGFLILPLAAAIIVGVLFSGIPLAYWLIGNLGLIIQRKDPWFDRWAG